MPIHFYCPLGHRLVVPDEREGKKGRCPVCHQKVIVPVANPAPSGRSKSRPEDVFQSAPVLPPTVSSGPRTEIEDVLQSELGIGAELAPPAPEKPADKPAVPPASTTPAPAPAPDPRWLNTPAPRRSRPGDLPPVTFSGLEPVPNGTAPHGMPSLPALQLPPLVLPTPWSTANRWWGEVPRGVDVGPYLPTARQTLTTYVLATVLVFGAMVGVVPALQTGASTAGWAQVVLLLVGLQLVYALWIAALADVATLRVGAVVSLVSATLYGAGMSVVLTGRGQQLPLDLFDVRYSAGGWCAANVFFFAALAYGFGYFSYVFARHR